MSLKLSPEATTRTGARGVPNPISTSGQTQTNSTCGSRRRTNLSCTISPLYRQGSKPMHLLMTILGFGNVVNANLPSRAQFLSAFRQRQIDGQDIRDTSRAAPAGPQDQKSLFGERPIPSRPALPQIVATPSRAGAFLRLIEAGYPLESLRRARSRAYHLLTTGQDHVSRVACPHLQTVGPADRELSRANHRSTSQSYPPDARWVEKPRAEKKPRAPSANLRCGGQIWPRPNVVQ